MKDNNNINGGKIEGDRLSEISLNPKESGVPLKKKKTEKKIRANDNEVSFRRRSIKKKTEQKIRTSDNKVSFHTLFDDYSRLEARREGNRSEAGAKMMDRHDDSNEKRLNHNVGEEGGKDGSVVHRSSHNVPSRTSDPNFWGPLAELRAHNLQYRPSFPPSSLPTSRMRKRLRCERSIHSAARR